MRVFKLVFLLAAGSALGTENFDLGIADSYKPRAPKLCKSLAGADGKKRAWEWELWRRALHFKTYSAKVPKAWQKQVIPFDRDSFGESGASREREALAGCEELKVKDPALFGCLLKSAEKIEDIHSGRLKGKDERLRLASVTDAEFDKLADYATSVPKEPLLDELLLALANPPTEATPKGKPDFVDQAVERFRARAQKAFPQEARRPQIVRFVSRFKLSVDSFAEDNDQNRVLMLWPGGEGGIDKLVQLTVPSRGGGTVGNQLSVCAAARDAKLLRIEELKDIRGAVTLCKDRWRTYPKDGQKPITQVGHSSRLKEKENAERCRTCHLVGGLMTVFPANSDQLTASDQKALREINRLITSYGDAHSGFSKPLQDPLVIGKHLDSPGFAEKILDQCLPLEHAKGAIRAQIREGLTACASCHDGYTRNELYVGAGTGREVMFSALIRSGHMPPGWLDGAGKTLKDASEELRKSLANSLAGCVNESLNEQESLLRAELERNHRCAKLPWDVDEKSNPAKPAATGAAH